MVVAAKDSKNTSVEKMAVLVMENDCAKVAVAVKMMEKDEQLSLVIVVIIMVVIIVVMIIIVGDKV